MPAGNRAVPCLLLFAAAGMSLYIPDIQMLWRWGRNYGRFCAQGLSIKKRSTSASRLAQKLHTTCWQYTSISEVRLKQCNLYLSLPAHRLTIFLNLPETEGGLLTFSHSGITQRNALRETWQGYHSLCCFSPCSCTASQCSVICTVLSSISFFSFLFILKVSEMWMSECRHLPVVSSKCDFLQVLGQWFMQCSWRSSRASNLGKVSLAIALFSPDHIMSSCQDGDTTW